MKLYPWLLPVWTRLADRLRAGNLAHGLLFSGPAGVGKNDFTKLFVQYALCQNATAELLPCDACVSCHLFNAGTHPDFLWVEPEEEGKQLGVDRVRELAMYLTLRPHTGSRKFAVLSPADAMNAFSGNSLLKSLEEPPPGSMLILITSRESALLPTIRSRCQTWSFIPPARDVAKAWLAGRLEKPELADLLLGLTNGAPLRALSFAQSGMLEHRRDLWASLEALAQAKIDPIKVAAQWSSIGAGTSLYWLGTWMTDMARLKFAIEPPLLGNPDLVDGLRVMAQSWQPDRLLRFASQVVAGQRLALTSANRELLLEDILLGWAESRAVR